MLREYVLKKKLIIKILDIKFILDKLYAWVFSLRAIASWLFICWFIIGGYNSGVRNFFILVRILGD
jgi:hypothetical protein